MAEESVERVAKVFKLMAKADTTQEDILELYADWCQTYDKDVTEYGYSGPFKAVEHLTRKLKEYGRTNDVRILDVGCGTGLVGEELHKRGYKNIDGVDISPEMLKVAEAKGLYGSLHKGAVGSLSCNDQEFPANQYDVAVSVGVFTSKHVGSEGFSDLVHVVKPGGLVYFSIKERPYNKSGTYEEKMNQLVQEGKWKLIMKDYTPTYVPDDGAWCFVYQIL